MTGIKSFFIAFSIYSKIPMPQFEWKEEDMKYTLCFFPWVGAVIGVLVYGWSIICKRYQIGDLCYTCIGTAIPLLITGGFHVDGFMDTMDGFHSYQPKERKLEILKDAHIGAFSVIMLGTYGLLYLGAFSRITDSTILSIVAAGFYFARVLSGIGVVSFPKAKKEGMLYLFADSAQKRIVKGTLILQGILCMAFMLWRSVLWGSSILLAALLSFAYYYYRTKKELGGITGDTAGFFIVVCETSMVVVAAVLMGFVIV